MKATSHGSLYADGALAGIAALVTNAATYLLYVAAAHALGPERGGSFLAIVASILLLSTLASVVGTSLTLDVAKIHAAGSESRIGALVRATGTWWLVGAVAIGLCVALLHESLDAFFHIDEASVIPLAALALVSNALLLLIRAILQGLGRFRSLLTSSCFEAAAKIIAAVVIILVPALSVAVRAMAASLCIAAVLSLLLIRSYISTRRTQPSEPIPLFGSPALIAALAGLSIMTFADGIVARHFLTVRESGVYNAVALGGRALITALAFLPSVVLSRIGRVRSGDDSLGAKVFGAVIVAGLCAVGIFALVPRLIIEIVAGPAFAAGAPLVAPYGVAAAGLALTTVIASYRIARGADWIGPAIAIVAIGETATLLVYHPSAQGLVRVVIAGHLAGLLTASVRRLGK